MLKKCDLDDGVAVVRADSIDNGRDMVFLCSFVWSRRRDQGGEAMTDRRTDNAVKSEIITPSTYKHPYRRTDNLVKLLSDSSTDRVKSLIHSSTDRQFDEITGTR